MRGVGIGFANETMGLTVFGLFKPKVGDQEYEYPKIAMEPIPTESPEQTATFGPALERGVGLITIVSNTVVELQLFSETESETTFIPEFNQFKLCGPWPIPGEAVPPSKSQK